ncbi:hypothetical protein [Aquimarina sp. 2304DJ70-9]|uniref:hypothetical protein n=1 Tax=Aquimarina penaris TaxID=3231044 RepID=UPI003461AF94
MVKVLTDDDSYSIFEMLSDDNFEIGDEVFWEEHNPLGHADISNLTKGEMAEVFFQDH